MLYSFLHFVQWNKINCDAKKIYEKKRAEQQDYSRFQLFKILYVLFIQNQVFW